MKKFVWWEDLDGVCCCPSCGHRVDNYYRDEGVTEELELVEPNFCPVCGQALDWTETRSFGVKEEH